VTLGLTDGAVGAGVDGAAWLAPDDAGALLAELPGSAWATRAENRPANPTAPAIIQRVSRDTRPSS